MLTTDIPKTMTVIEISRPGGPDVLQVAERTIPELGTDEVLIRVSAAGVNRADILQRQGRYPPPPGITDIPGLEVCGEIVRVGANVSTPAVGSQTCALLAGGGYAQYVAAPASQCLPVPTGLDTVTAAALPEAFCTVYFNVFQRAGLRSGQVFLVHGGSGGIGTTAILMAKAFDVRVIATAGSSEKCEACRALGADHVINYREQDFVTAAWRVTGGRGADVILDMVGGDYMRRNLQAAAVNGRISVIAAQCGTKVEMDLGVVMTKRLNVMGSTLRAQSIEEKSRIVDAVLRDVWPLFASKCLIPPISARFPLSQADQAHALMESGTHIGKIVLLP